MPGREVATKYNIKYFYDITDRSNFKANPDYKGVCHVALAQVRAKPPRGTTSSTHWVGCWSKQLSTDGSKQLSHSTSLSPVWCAGFAGGPL